jgi:hypothetical protein
MQATLDRLAWQNLVKHLPDLEPWCGLDKVSEALLDQVASIGCMFPNFPLTGGQHYPKVRSVRIWCVNCQRVEFWKPYVGQILAQSLFREKGMAYWLDVVVSDLECLHFCHNATCENPMHSTYEGKKVNVSRQDCHRLLQKESLVKTKVEAIAAARRQCRHDQRCFALRVRPKATAESVEAQLVSHMLCSPMMRNLLDTTDSYQKQHRALRWRMQSARHRLPSAH